MFPSCIVCAIRAVQTWLAMTGIRLIARHLFRFRIEVSGREHVPRGEPLLVAGGPHRNWIDGFLLLYAMPNQPRIVFLGSENAQRMWWRRLILWLTGAFEPVSTTSALNREALEAGLGVLARGDRLGIFPEGWDHMDGPTREIGELRRGVAYLAQHSGRRVLPVSLAGSRPLWRGATLRVQIGTPIAPPPRWACKAEQHTWTESLRATLLAQQPPDLPVLPAAERVWSWLTTWLN
ncbi:MAG: lysophospholipid acyltransferase family protein [Thermomicrobiales bacterium]